MTYSMMSFRLRRISKMLRPYRLLKNSIKERYQDSEMKRMPRTWSNLKSQLRERRSRGSKLNKRSHRCTRKWRDRKHPWLSKNSSWTLLSLNSRSSKTTNTKVKSSSSNYINSNSSSSNKIHSRCPSTLRSLTPSKYQVGFQTSPLPIRNL
jgi:hypothetical protein